MNLLSRYIFRQIMIPFLMCTAIMTAIAWLTQAARLLDLIILQGQGAGVFFRLTLLLIPGLAGLIAPIGLFIACIYSLNRMNQDSELAVIYAAGSGKWQVVRPYIAASLLVAGIVIYINAYVMPSSLQSLRTEIVQIRADLVANLLQPGRFFSPIKQVTIYFRERDRNNDMLGVIIHDKRDKDGQVTILAQRGTLVSNETGNFMVFINGNIQRKKQKSDKVDIVAFDSYAYDLAGLSPEAKVPYLKPKEKYIGDLLNPDPTDPYFRAWPAKMRSELHRRLTSPFYPIVFTLIALAFLSNAQTARRGQIIRILLTIAVVATLRGTSLALTNLSGKKDWAVFSVYGMLIIAIIAALYVINSNRKNILRGIFRNQRFNPSAA